MTTFTAMPKYEAYKDSGVDWLGEIPKEWSTRKVKYLFRIGRGRVISQQELDDNGCYPVYSSQTQNDGILGYISTFDFDCEQITWTTDGANAGTVFLRKGKHNCTNVCGTLQPISKQKISLEFLKNALSIAAQFYKRPDTNGAKIMNGEMAEIFVTFPPLEAQIAIANFLDEKIAKIDEAITIKEKQIELLKERKQIIIQQAVTQGLDPTVPMKDSGVEWIGKIPAHWEVLPLKRLATLSPTVKVENRKSKELVTFLAMEKVSTSGNIEQDTFLPICNVSQGFTIFNRGDVIIAKITPCFENGKSAWLNTLATDFGYGSTEFHVVRCSQRILGSFLYLIVSSPLFLTAGEAMMTGSAGQKRVPSSFIQNFPTAIPNIEEQARIVNEVHEEFNQIDFVIQSSNYQIEKLKEYKTTLINSAVTGKIKVV